MTTTRFHMQATISYIEKAVRDRQRHGQEQNYLTIDDQPIDHEQALIHLTQMRADGLSVVPCCSNTDATGRCLGLVN